MANLDLTEKPTLTFQDLVRMYCEFLRVNSAEPEKILCTPEMVRALKNKTPMPSKRLMELWMDVMGTNSLEKIEIVENKE